MRRTFRGSWLTRRAILTRWTPLALGTYGLYLYKRGFTEDVSDLELFCYENLPLRVVSKAWGAAAHAPIPTPLRPYVYGRYCRAFGVDLDEAADPDLNNYPTLASFFARELRPDARPLDENATIVSPCDGTVLHCCRSTTTTVEQVKGVSYPLEDFLGEISWKRKGEGEPRDPKLDYYEALLEDTERNSLHHCVIYLAPGDYHRFRWPCDLSVRHRRHFSGKLLSVNPLFAKLSPGLFCRNERVVYAGRWAHGFFAFAPVGATNVGSIRMYDDAELATNGRRKKAPQELSFEGFEAKRGAPAGQFDMGSTIVLAFEAPKNFRFDRAPGDKIKVGQRLGHLATRPHS